MTTPKRISFSIAVAVIVLCTFTVTAFASPSIEDATVTFSIKGYYTQYAQTVTYTQNLIINTDGTTYAPGSNNYKTTSVFSVYGGGTLFVYRSDSSSHTHGIYGVCFYDSANNVVPYTLDQGDNPDFISVPELAVSARVSIYRSGTVSAAGSFSKPIAAPQSGVNINNYQYLWGEISNVTIDSDGYIVLPYQIYTYTWFWLDFDFFDSTYQFRNIAFTFYSVYTGGYFTGERLLDYTRLSVDSYYKDDNGDTTFDEIGYTSSGDNPFRFVGQIPYNRFSGFRLYVETDQVSTSIKIKIYDFELDGEDVAVQLQTQAALAELDQLAGHLDLPTPDTSVIYNNVNNVALQLQDTNFSGFDWFGPSGSIVMQMIITTMSIAAISYIIFGKKES